jgi:hypothetical protein
MISRRMKSNAARLSDEIDLIDHFEECAGAFDRTFIEILHGNSRAEVDNNRIDSHLHSYN